jgi:RNA polymerase sigma-70 factor (ECF subfamily)
MTVNEQIIDGCINGDRDAQEVLYKAYSPTMFGICLRYSKSRDEAQDIMQEGFIKVFGNIHKFRKEGSLEGWVKRIMVNTSLNYIQKQKRSQYHKDIDEINELNIEQMEEPEPDIQYNQKELLDIVQKLPDGYKSVFNLYVFEKYKHREIAEILGISVNTSKSQLSKARVFLQKELHKLTQQKKKQL